MATLTPRTTPPGAWKGWLKDGVELTNRVLPGWLLLSFVALGVPLFLMAQTRSPAVAGFCIMALLLISPLFHSFQQHSFDSVDGADGSSPFQEFAHDVHRNIRHYAYQGACRLGLFIVIIVAVSAASQGNATQAPQLTSWDLFWQTSMHLYAWPLVLRREGVFGFRLWLRTRIGVDAGIAGVLDEAAWIKNMGNLARCSAGYYACFFLAASVPAIQPLLVLLGWYAAAVCRCAYMDIFFDKRGLSAKREVAEARPDTVVA